MTRATGLRPAQQGLPTQPGGRTQPPAGVPVDAGRWPDVAQVPGVRVHAVIARRLLRMAAARLPIRVEPRGGTAFGGGRPGSPTMVLHRPADFYRRIGANGLIGFGESYMAGDWDCAELPDLLTVLCTRIDRLVPRGLQWLRQLYVPRPPADWNADEQGARRNVHQHYDLSNDMFALFLDETMTYSAALFAGEDREPRPDSLATAQRRKIDRLLDQAGVGPGSRVLEIGTGWGELAIRAAARGATVRSITVSAQQCELARRRIADAGVAGLATVELTDYREVTGQYDAIVSVEMIEAVSERYWPDYFRALDRLLAPGGRIGLQSITMAHERMLATRRSKTWILKYIFPGGLIPSVQAIEDNLREHTGLHVAGTHEFGPDYARTLQIWQARFSAAAGQLAGLGFDEVFRRMWLLYLSYAEAGFRARYLQVHQFVLCRDDQTLTRPDTGAAGLLQPVARQLFGGELPVRLRAWDGSEAGPPAGPAVVLRSPRALRRLLWHPGELGLAQAYVTGELDVEGDITDGLRLVWRAIRERGLSGGRLTAAGWVAAARAAVALRIPGPRPAAPATQARVGGRRHSRGRDQAVIAHHYDVPAEFYQLILDPAMAYSCALWTSADPGYTLADAQRDKLDAICRKLELGPGQRLLDVGCGWGSLSAHAASSYRAEVTAVTLAAEQARFVRDRVATAGLAGQVAVRNDDYRDIGPGQYDAVASVEMGEHVGDREYPAFCAQLLGLLKPGGRLLIQQMSRGAAAPGGGKFIERYIAPDMHMRPVGETIGLLEAAGFEVLDVLAMREHYTRTIRAWLATLEQRMDEVTALIGAESARVWRLYLAGAALAFDEGRMGVHQILAVRP